MKRTSDRIRARLRSAGQHFHSNDNIAAFIEPAEFERYREEALELGFAHVESGPYVRSSYHAERYLDKQLKAFEPQ